MYNPDRKQAIPGDDKLALPPESGTSAASQQEDIDDDLFNRLLGGDHTDNIACAVDDHLFRKIPLKQAGRNYTVEYKKKLIKSALDLDAKKQRPGYYWIWNISETENENYKISFRRLAQEIKANYPTITLLSLDFNNIDQEIEENELFDVLHHTQDD